MALPISRYVNITSGVAGAAAIPQRLLIGRFFTTSVLVPTSQNVDFTSAQDVGTYFGFDSDEYARAVFYFGWVSKSVSRVPQISFFRWTGADDVASTIFGKPGIYSLGQFTSITTGDFTLTLNGFTHHLTAIDLSAAGSLTAVAADVQAAIRTYSAGGAAWTAATVTFDATRSSFNFISGTEGNDIISITPGVTADLAAALGWETGAILSNGMNEQSIADVLTLSDNLNNNFGSFAFMDALTLDQVTDAAEWNNAQNVKYIYSVPVTAANAAAWEAALGSIGGTTLSLQDSDLQYPEQCPMMIFGATRYNDPNSVQNYEFQEFNIDATVTDTPDANLYDGLRVNYIGQIQQAGQYFNFYQQGLMLGLPSDPADQNLYANEIWLKDALQTVLMSMLLALPQVPANNAGRARVLSVAQGPITLAVSNGTISSGKLLNDIQKSDITLFTNDPNAWQQVQNRGYWIDAHIETYIVSGVTKYKAVYLLIYSKDDIIRLIDGTDVLI